MRNLILCITLAGFCGAAHSGIITYTLPQGWTSMTESDSNAPHYWNCGLKTDKNPLLPSSSYPNKTLRGFTIQNKGDVQLTGVGGNAATAYSSRLANEAERRVGYMYFPTYDIDIGYDEYTEIPRGTYLVCDMTAAGGKSVEMHDFTAGNHQYFKLNPPPSALVSVRPATINLGSISQNGALSGSAIVYYMGCNGKGSFSVKIYAADRVSALYKSKLKVTLPPASRGTCKQQQGTVNVSFDASDVPVPAAKYYYKINVYYTVTGGAANVQNTSVATAGTLWSVILR